MKTQNEAILEHLRNNEKITPLDALNAPDIRTFKLSSRIGEIKRTMLAKDESIMDSWMKTDSGKKVKIYFLVKVGQLNLL